jgi:hypothetical protein
MSGKGVDPALPPASLRREVISLELRAEVAPLKISGEPSALALAFFPGDLLGLARQICRVSLCRMCRLFRSRKKGGRIIEDWYLTGLPVELVDARALGSETRTTRIAPS